MFTVSGRTPFFFISIVFSFFIFLTGCGGSGDRQLQGARIYRSSIASPKGFTYFGYYANATQYVGTGDYTAEISDHANLAWVNWDEVENSAKIVENAAKLGMKSVVDTQWIFFDSKLRLRPDYAIRWNEAADILGPYVDSIVAFYVMDEPYGNAQGRGIPINILLSELKAANAAMKASFPDTPIALTLDHASVNENLVIPEGLDWVGFDCYYGTFEMCQGHPIPWYVDILKTKINSDQKLYLVPDAFFRNTTVVGDNEDRLLDQVSKYCDLAMSEPKIVAMAPFLYQSFTEGYEPFNGVSSMPRLKEAYRQLGQNLRNRGTCR